MSIETVSLLVVLGTLCTILLAAAGSIALTVIQVRLIRRQVQTAPRFVAADRGVSAGIPCPGQAVPQSLQPVPGAAVVSGR